MWSWSEHFEGWIGLNRSIEDKGMSLNNLESSAGKALVAWRQYLETTEGQWMV